MPEMNSYDAGSFCWIELATADPDAAKSFYNKLFGWSYRNAPPEGPAFYSIFRHGERDLAGMYGLPDEMKSAGVPTHWLCYVAVDEVEAAARKAESLGAKILRGPTDVMEEGRMALIQDPTGATLALWEAKCHPGSGTQNEFGAPCWFELNTRDADAGKAFYRKLFGWEFREGTESPMPYSEIHRGAAPFGGVLQMTEEFGNIPSHWMTYFLVEDCDAAAAKVTELGGNVCVPPSDIPNVGRFSVVMDPQGGTFSFVQLTHPM